MAFDMIFYSNVGFIDKGNIVKKRKSAILNYLKK